MKLLPRSEKFSAIGMSITNLQIHAIQLKGRGKSLKIGRMLKLPRLLDDQGKVKALDAKMLSRLRMALDANGFQGSNLILSVPEDQLLSSMIELPPINGKIPVNQIAKLEMSRIHHCQPEDFELASWVLPSADRSNKNAQVIATIFLHEQADKLLDLFEDSNFNVLAIDILPQALARACHHFHSTTAQRTILHHSFDSIHIVSLDNKTIIYERRIADLGLAKLISHIQNKFNIQDKQAAIRLIQQAGFQNDPIDPKDTSQSYSQTPGIRKMANDHYQKILQELGNALAYTKQQYSKMSSQEIFLTGLGNDIPGWKLIIQQSLESKTNLVHPVDLLPCAEHLKSDEQIKEPGYLPAIGLALYHQGGTRAAS